MSVDCKWIEHNLEALFSGTLSQQDDVRARHHIDNCGACGSEITALNSIDPLIKRYFDQELRTVQQGSIRRVAKGRIVSLAAGALIATSLLLVTVSRLSTPHTTVLQSTFVQSVASDSRGSAVPSLETAEAPSTEVARSKPLDGVAANVPQTLPGIPAIGNDVPQFLVTDVAGYARTLDDYRGHVFVVGVLNAGQDTAVNFETRVQDFRG